MSRARTPNTKNPHLQRPGRDVQLRLLAPQRRLLLRMLAPGLGKHGRRMLPVRRRAQPLQEEQGGVVPHRGVQGCGLARALLPLGGGGRGGHGRLCQLAPPQQVSQVELPGAAGPSKHAAAGSQEGGAWW